MAETQQVSKWDTRELNALIASKKYLQDQAVLDSSRERMRTAEQRWKEVESLCRSSNVRRDWKQCKKRWEKLLTEFKKVYDYQKQTPSGTNGYFQLSRGEKKDRSLPATFQEDLFQEMLVFVPLNRAVNPHPDQYVDSGVENDTRETIVAGSTTTIPIIPDAVVNEDGVGEQRTVSSPEVEHQEADSIPDTVHSVHTMPQVTPVRNAHQNRSQVNTTPPNPAIPNTPRQSVPTPTTTSPGPRDPSPGSVNGQGEGSGDRTTRGWKRTRGERTASELHKITQTFVAAISEDRVSRREEHQDIITFEGKKLEESLAQQRETGRDVANALAFIGESIRYLADVRDRS